MRNDIPSNQMVIFISLKFMVNLFLGFELHATPIDNPTTEKVRRKSHSVKSTRISTLPVSSASVEGRHDLPNCFGRVGSRLLSHAIPVICHRFAKCPDRNLHRFMVQIHVFDLHPLSGQIPAKTIFMVFNYFQTQNCSNFGMLA